MYDFTYQKPGSLADAVKVLSGDMEAKALAGGQTFIPVLKQRLNKPSTVVDLSKLGLSGITVAGDKIVIGAMTRHADVASNADIQAKIPGLAHMASMIGDEAVRHRGTMGGSLANNDPAACYPSAILALGGTIKTDRRSIAADDFFQGMFTTALEQGEIITSIELPIPQPPSSCRSRRSRLTRSSATRPRATRSSACSSPSMLPACVWRSPAPARVGYSGILRWKRRCRRTSPPRRSTAS